MQFAIRQPRAGDTTLAIELSGACASDSWRAGRDLAAAFNDVVDRVNARFDYFKKAYFVELVRKPGTGCWKEAEATATTIVTATLQTAVSS